MTDGLADVLSLHFFPGKMDGFSLLTGKNDLRCPNRFTAALPEP